MFKKILIANRGEIAVRIMRTCREMGIETVGVYSEADEKALHAMTADEAVLLGPAAPGESYLHMDRILKAARETGAEAVHPGYGFLAENHVFAQKCADAGVVFIGPPPGVIEALGRKTRARRIMREGGVPVIPGLMNADPDPDNLAAAAEEIGYPLLIKAAAGGGGKGMRTAHAEADLAEAARSCCSEAAGAFGDGSLYLERWFPVCRHVEVQVLADGEGNCIHLGERECSIQRRHQKIIEETPSPALTPAMREEICASAVRAARAAGYVNAGTVEFLLDDQGNHYFLEVNTRLQVEHPVTEMTTGVDLVRQQIMIAAGLGLKFRQEDVVPRGHSIECRIYAEDPAAGFMPSPGRIEYLLEPSGPGLRNDGGAYSGCEIPHHYDPIVSKLTAWAEDRDAAIDRMIRALEHYVVLGVRTAIPYLIEVLDHDAFRRGETFTGFLDEYFSAWSPSGPDEDEALIAAGLDAALPRKRAASAVAASGPSRNLMAPWDTLGQWRM